MNEYFLALLREARKLTIGYNSLVSLAVFEELAAAGLVVEVERNQYGVVYVAI